VFGPASRRAVTASASIAAWRPHLTLLREGPASGVDEGVVDNEAPVGHEFEPRARAMRCVLDLGVPGALQEGLGRRVDEEGVGEIGVGEFTGLDMPLALEVVAQDRLPVVILRRSGRVVFDEHIVESLGAGLIADAYHRPLRAKQQGGMQPEQARLEIVSVLACSNSQYESMLIEGPDRGCQGYGGGPTGWSATLENALGQAGVVRLFDSMSAARIHN